MAVFCVAEKYQREQEIDKMGGFLESQQKKTVYLICFSEQIIIPIWEPDAPEWLSTAKRKVITEPFTTSRMRRFVPNSTRMSMKCGAISVSDVSQILNHSH